jgi:hypothetical protein
MPSSEIAAIRGPLRGPVKFPKKDAAWQNPEWLDASAIDEVANGRLFLALHAGWIAQNAIWS